MKRSALILCAAIATSAACADCAKTRMAARARTHYPAALAERRSRRACQSTGRDRHHQAHGQPHRRQAARSPGQRLQPDAHALCAERQRRATGCRCLSGRRLSDPRHRSRRHRSLRLAQLHRRDLRAGEVSRAQHRPVSQIRRGLAGCAARARHGSPARRRVAH